MWRINMEFYLLVFKNTSDALKGEAEFNDRKIPHAVYPTPPQILGSCGISLRLTPTEIDAANKVLDLGLNYKALYKVTRMSIIVVREYEENDKRI